MVQAFGYYFWIHHGQKGWDIILAHGILWFGEWIIWLKKGIMNLNLTLTILPINRLESDKKIKWLPVRDILVVVLLENSKWFC